MHVACWEGRHTCVHCGEKVTSQYYDVAEGKLHTECWEEWRANLAPKCLQCGLPASGKHYPVDGGRLHVECWESWQLARGAADACLVCSEPIVAQHYALAEGKVHLNCWAAYRETKQRDMSIVDEGDETAAPAAGSPLPAHTGPLAEAEAAEEADAFLRSYTMREAAAAEGGAAAAASGEGETPRVALADGGLGWFYKQGQVAKSWKRRWAAVRAGCLCYYADAACTKLKGSVALQGAELEECVVRAAGFGYQEGFEVVHKPSGRTLLAFPDAAWRGASPNAAWIDVLTREVEKLKEAKPGTPKAAALQEEQAVLARLSQIQIGGEDAEEAAPEAGEVAEADAVVARGRGLTLEEAAVTAAMPSRSAKIESAAKATGTAVKDFARRGSALAAAFGRDSSRKGSALVASMYKSGKGLIATAAPEVADDDAPKAKQLLRKLTVKFIPTAPSAKDFAAAVADADAEAVAVAAAAAEEEKQAAPVAEAAPAADAYGARRGSIPMGAQMLRASHAAAD